MPLVPNKLMPWIQAIVALIIIVLFCLTVLGPMLGLKPTDVDMKETLKSIMFILMGWLFGSSANSSRKDEVLAAAATPSTVASVHAATLGAAHPAAIAAAAAQRQQPPGTSVP